LSCLKALLLSAVFFMSAFASANSCKDLFDRVETIEMSSHEIEPKDLVSEMLELVTFPESEYSEFEVINLFTSMVDATDSKVSNFLRDLGQNPLLSKTLIGSQEIELLAKKLSKDLNRLKRATEINPNLLQKIERRFAKHRERKIKELEKRIQQKNFSSHQATEKLTAENAFYMQTRQELNKALQELDSKIQIADEILKKLDHLQIFGSLSDARLMSLKSTIIPQLANTVQNMKYIYTTADSFNSGFQGRIDSNTSLLKDIKITTEAILPTVGLTGDRPLNLAPQEHKEGIKEQISLKLAIKNFRTELVNKHKSTLVAIRKHRGKFIMAGVVVIGGALSVDYSPKHGGLSVNDIMSISSQAQTQAKSDEIVTQFYFKYPNEIKTGELVTLEELGGVQADANMIIDYIDRHSQSLSVRELVEILDASSALIPAYVVEDFFEKNKQRFDLDDVMYLLENYNANSANIATSYFEAQAPELSVRQAIRLASYAYSNPATYEQALLLYTMSHKKPFSISERESLIESVYSSDVINKMNAQFNH